jgi:glycosyltransferase involved in cell wall biosynthesis
MTDRAKENGTHFDLSVVIPHLNEGDNLRRCLLALDRQRTDDIAIEIILVDNGSDQFPEAACAGISDLRLVREVAPGPGPARNLGASLASADIVAFVDADCIVQPSWALSILGYMAQRPEIGVVGGDIGILVEDPSRPTSIETYESIYSYRARLYVERHNYTATGNMAIRREVFRSVGPFGGIGIMEDREWGQRAAMRGYRMAFLSEARVLTPSCKSFVELARRWDRHVSHEFENVLSRRRRVARWLLTAALVAASPLIEIPRVLRSDRVAGLRNKLLALGCLTRIRLYRARKMLAVVRRDRALQLVSSWNREKY